MPCDILEHRDGSRTIICSSRGRRRKPRPCSVCLTRPSSLECDGPAPRRSSGTCDAPLCEQCTYRDPNITTAMPWLDTHDLCPRCRVALARPVQERLL